MMDKVRLGWRLLNDGRVPTWVKVFVPLLTALYFISPLDFIPDFLIGPGQLDDLGVILLGLSLIVRFSPQNIVAEHRRNMGMEADPTEQPGQPRQPGANPGGDPSATRRVWTAPSTGDSGTPTRRIDGEYRVVGDK